MYLDRTSDVEGYRENSTLIFIEVDTDSLTTRENRLFPHVFINSFEGETNGERKSFAMYFFPSRIFQGVKIEHEQLYALVNISEFATLGTDEAPPIPIMKYGTTADLANHDFAPRDVNTYPGYDIHKKNVEGYLTYIKEHYGISVMKLVHITYLWFSLPWGIACLVYSLFFVRFRKSTSTDQKTTSRG